MAFKFELLRCTACDGSGSQVAPDPGIEGMMGGTFGACIGCGGRGMRAVVRDKGKELLCVSFQRLIDAFNEPGGKDELKKEVDAL